MKRHLPWALAASFVVVACATNEELDFIGPSTENPNSSILGDASTTDDGSTSHSDGGTDGGSGTIDLAVCGDGKKATTEECDDGNVAPGDGCSDTCKAESTGPEDVCPGTAITLTGTGADTRKGSVTGGTSGTFPHYAGSCGGGTGRDSVYSITPDVTGLLTVKLTSTFDSILYAQRTCGDSKTEAACNDAAGSKGGETIKLPVTQGQPVFIMVDGYSGSSGTFTLDVELATAFCGNGVAEAPEACDDGNMADGDGCSSTCALESGGLIYDCPGQTVLLNGTAGADRKISFQGDTNKLGTTSSSLSPSGCSGSGVNAVYGITPDITGSMTAHLLANYDAAALYVRAECDTTETQLDCRDTSDPLVPLEITVPVFAGIPAFVVVDASSTSAAYKGAYVLDVTVKPGACGNKVLDGGEECDDGNAVSGDGCTSGCKLEPISPAADKCPGVALPVAAVGDGTYTGVVTSSTSSMAADYKPKSTSCSSITVGRDAVYALTSPINGLLDATVRASFDSMLFVRNGCDADPTTFDDLGCSAANDGSTPETVHAPVKAGETVYVIVDGEATAAHGVFELGVKISPATCGNGTLEGGETCDDGNAASGDGCSSTCQLEPNDKHDTCANAEEITLAATTGGNFGGSISSGNTNLGHEQSFSTPTGTTPSCSSSGRDAIYRVKAPITGVMTVEVPVATFNVTLGARADGSCPVSTTATMPIACSNSTTDDGAEEISFSVTKDEYYYLIVDSPAMSSTTYNTVGTFTMLVNVRPPGCGDGLLASGVEQCDDGNTTNGDGCSATCTAETLTGIDTCPGYTLPLTGSGTEPRTGVVTVDTKPLAANYSGNCGGNSKDGVVVVTPPIDGKLTAKLTGLDYHAVLYARMTCNDGSLANQKACDDDFSTSGVAIPSSRDISITGVKAGVPIYLFVDGFNGQSGLARLNVTVTP